MSSTTELLQHPATEFALLSIAEGMAFVSLTTIYNHRQLTHESIELAPPAEHAARAVMWMLGVQPRLWAQVHLVHHSIEDANLLPIKETADYLHWRQDHSAPDHPDVPRFFGGLDRGAVFRPERILQIGDITQSLVNGRYEPPNDYSVEDGQRLLDPLTARYFYVPKNKDGKKVDKLYDWEQPDLPRNSLLRLAPELRDPHSPALHILGVPGILRDNVPLYKEAAYYFQKREAAGEDFGQDAWDRFIYDKVKAGMTTFYVGNAGYQIGKNLVRAMVRDGHLSRDEVIKSIIKGGLTGSLVAASADGLLIAGGKLTNGAGHAGKFRRLTQLMFSHDIIMNDDGSYTTDNTPLGWISMDEAGRQRKHHEKPDHISYTDEAGIQGVEEAPFGKTIEFLVNHKVLMKPGKQYGARDASAGTVLNPRPDTRNKAVQLIQESRVETRDAKLRVA